MFGNKKILLFAFSFILVLGFFVSAPATLGALKDTDTDGLSDEAEVTTFLTQPSNPDTDGDGIEDGQEILNNTSPLTKDVGAAAAQEVPLAWYIGRASGILAFLLLSVVVINGLLISTRMVSKVLPPALNYEMHRFLSWIALLTVVVHFVSFTFDDFFKLSFLEALVPFAVDRPFTSSLGYSLTWAVGIGIIGFYIIISQIASSELKNKLISLKNWRRLHYLSFIGYLAFLGHGIFAGSDTKAWWMIWTYALSGGLVSILVFLRIYLSIQKQKLAKVQNAPAIAVTPPLNNTVTRHKVTA